MIDQGPFEFKDFQGGFTDNYLDGSLQKCRRAENLLILEYGNLGKLRSRPGSEILYPLDPQIPLGEQRVGTLLYFEDTLLIHSGDKLYTYDAGFNELLGPTSNGTFPTAFSYDTVLSFAEWNHHLIITSDEYTAPVKLFKDGSSILNVRTAGLPELASNPSIAHANGAGSYTYKFVHEYTYTVGTVQFLDIGPVREVFVPTAGTVGTNTITNIPVLSNGSALNYDTANVKIGIYRNVLDGATWYKVAEVTNGTTSYVDTTTDTALQNNQLLYTEGGVVENDPPPLAKLVHVVEGVALYACIKEGAQKHNNRVRQSIPGDIDSCPIDFVTDIDADIVGMSSANGIPVLLCSQGVFRLDGRYDELGRGSMVAQRISDTATCISSQSVVQTLEGVFWWGKDKIYFTDGQRVIPLNDDWPTTHALYTSAADKKRRIVGRYDSVNRRIWWSVQGGVIDNDACIVLDLNWPLTDQSSFTRMGNGSESWAPTAIEFKDGNLVRGDRRGFLFQHDDGLRTDPLVDMAKTPDDWITEAIIFDYESCATNFGNNFVRKFIPRVSAQFRNETNISVQIISNNDDGRQYGYLKPIRFKGNFTWGDPDVLWGDPLLTWNFSGLIEEQRRFPAKGLRCSYKSIRMTNAYVPIYSSIIRENCSIDSFNKTATLLNGDKWPESVSDLKISFANDWGREFSIVERLSDTVLQYEDNPNLSVDSADSDWEIRGVPKGEVFHLVAFTLHFSQFGRTQSAFRPNEIGSIA
jgi:hypothetical protein